MMRLVATAMILCAGFGTRLRPLTDELPKPLVPVGDRSVLAHIAGQVRASGIERVVINVHHLRDRFINISEDLGTKIEVVNEPQIRGTAGGVNGARHLLGSDPVLVWNGDILALPPIGELLAAAAAGGLCLAIAPRECGAGSVGIDADGNVVRLRGQLFGAEDRGGDYIGVAGLGAGVVQALPEQGCLIGDVALPRLHAGKHVQTAPVRGVWSDLGDVASYHRANLDWLDAETSDGIYSGSGALVSSEVRLVRTVVGANARVEGAGVLERVVVWPGARVTAPLQDAIVTTAGHVVSAR